MDSLPLLLVWLRPFLPTPAQALAGVPLALGYALPRAWLVGRLSTARGAATPYTRKLFHFLIISGGGVIQLVWGLSSVTVFGTVVALMVRHAVWRGAG